MNKLIVKEILPHRDPFLFIDSVRSITKFKEIIALRKFSDKEYFFKGHFPGNPVVPGVIIIESLAQAGGILVYESFKENLEGKLPALAGLNNVRFRKPVRPNNNVILKVELIKSRSILWKLEGRAYVDNDLVAEAEITASVF
jgi:3-hydroxyacyl-[acyl-carrier-protein] dehydratase